MNFLYGKSVEVASQDLKVDLAVGAYEAGDAKRACELLSSVVTAQSATTLKDLKSQEFAFRNTTVHSASIEKAYEQKSMIGLTCYVPGLGKNGMTPRVSTVRKSPLVKQKGAKSGKLKSDARLHQQEIQRTWNLQSMIQPFSKEPAIMNNRPFYIAQMLPQATLLTTSTIVGTSSGTNFTISMLPGITELASVFDQYKIIRIEAWVQYSPTTTTQTGPQEAATQWVSAVDYDDSNAPSTVNELLEFENSMTSSLVAGHYHDFTPHVAVASYSGAFTSFNNEIAPWIDMASSTVQHYGLKCAAAPSIAANTLTYTARIHALFRLVR